MPNNATFYFEGETGLVRTLKLTGKFLDEFSTDKGLERFRELSEFLCKKALGENNIDFVNLLPNKESFEQVMQVNGTTVKAWAKRYPNEHGSEIFLTLSR